jgi:hypothetical protein
MINDQEAGVTDIGIKASVPVSEMFGYLRYHRWTSVLWRLLFLVDSCY